MQRIYSNGYEWIWNGRWIFCMEVEKEMRYNGESTEECGYPAHTFYEARAIVDAHPYPLSEYLESRKNTFKSAS